MEVVEEAKRHMARWSGRTQDPPGEASARGPGSERESYLARLRSYKASKWSAWKHEARPTRCAARGWRCVGVGRLRCDDCAATLRDDGEGDVAAKGRIQAHADGCRWRKRSVEEANPPGPRAGEETDALERWEERVETLRKLPWLPDLHVPTSYETIVGTRARDKDDGRRKAHVLSTFGWCVRHLRRSVVSNGSPKVRPRVLEACETAPSTQASASSWTLYCRECGAEVGAWRLANGSEGREREATPNPSARGRRRATRPTIAGGPLGARVGESDPPKATEGAPVASRLDSEVHDVVRAHRYYCEWIQGRTNQEQCGWQVLAEKVCGKEREKDFRGVRGDETEPEVVGKRKRESDPQESLAKVKRVLRGRRQ